VKGVGEYWLFSSNSRSFGYGFETMGIWVKMIPRFRETIH
jgi:hypothetical protein